MPIKNWAKVEHGCFKPAIGFKVPLKMSVIDKDMGYDYATNKHFDF